MENKLTSGIIGMEIIVRGTKILFPDTPQLKGKRIKHIEFLNATSLPKSHNNITVVSDTANMFVTLVNNGTSNEVIQHLNVQSLNVNGDRLFINKIIDLNRSYIDYTGAENQTGKAVFILFYYDEPASWSAINTNNRTVIKSLELTLTGRKTYFAYDQEFVNRKILSLLLLFPTISALGSEVVTTSHIKNKFITLSRKNVEFFSNVPISIFWQDDNYYQIRLQGIMIDFQKSFVYSLTETVDDKKTLFFNTIIDDNK